ncbi:MAG: M67 family metallopeptidase [Chloroflexi bacterium]|nr:M67 family metallopeptidase [Chloroflexota bacterium]
MLILERQYVDEMIAHALEESPNECCGILAGKDGRCVKLYRALNAEASPYRYNMDPDDLFRIYREIEKSGWDILAIYHSHTFSEAHPSQTDINLAFYPESYYILVSLMNPEQPIVRAFRIDREDRTVAEHEVHVVSE